MPSAEHKSHSCIPLPHPQPYTARFPGHHSTEADTLARPRTLGEQQVEETDLQLAIHCPMTQRACKYPKCVRPPGMNLTSVLCPVLSTQLSLRSASRGTQERQGAQAARQGRMNHHSKSKHSDTCFSCHPSTFTQVCLPVGLISGHYLSFCVGLRPHEF